MRPKTFFNPKLFLLILVSLILFFSFLTYWRFREFQRSLSKIEFPKFEMPKTELFPPPPKIEEMEFVSPDGKLKLKYGSDWRKMEGNNLPELSKQPVEEGKMLFFAQKISESNIGFLLVQEFELRPGQKLKDIIDKIKKGTKEGEVEISNLKIEEKEANFEAEYQKEDYPGFHSKEKIIKEENKAYLIGVTAFSQNWLDFEPEANQILNSTQILNK